MPSVDQSPQVDQPPQDELQQRLARWWGRFKHDPDALVRDLRRPGGGQSNDTWLFEAHWNGNAGSEHGCFVVRRQPSTNQLFHDADVVREGTVLAALAGTGVPVPAVVAIEADPGPLGAPFFVMEQIEGEVPLARPSIHSVGWLTTLSPAQITKLWSGALDVVVEVHGVDWRRTHRFLSSDTNTPREHLRSHVARFVELYRWTARGRRFPITDAALHALEARLPDIDPGEPVLLWGDARVGNMIFAPDLRVAAAIDWEVASIGTPAIDLAHWLFFDEFSTTASGIERLDGWPDRATTIAEYTRRSGRSVDVLDDLDYFDLLEAFFIATTLIRQADLRVERGLAPADTRMGHDNAVTQMLARLLGLPEPELSPDYLAHRGLRA